MGNKGFVVLVDTKILFPFFFYNPFKNSRVEYSTAVNVAKAVHHLDIPKEKRLAFSMSNVKTLHFNEMMLDLILSNLAIKTKKKKIKKLKWKIRMLSKIAA